MFRVQGCASVEVGCAVLSPRGLGLFLIPRSLHLNPPKPDPLSPEAV